MGAPALRHRAPDDRQDPGMSPRGAGVRTHRTVSSPSGRRVRRGAGAALLLVAAAPAGRAGGQPTTVGAMATAVATHAAPALLGVSRTEGYVTQPALMGDVRGGPWRFTGTVNLEGLTLRRGELTLGSYGEGYVDRRHPHTLVHEAIGAAVTPAGRRWQGSLAAGKGFVPFGTDDPMMRPFVKFPVNHHHAQLPERAQVIAAVRLGPAARALVLEQAWYNGDEPTGPWAWPQWRRVGDSRATRLTAQRTAPGGARWELQASRAFVRSPGIIQGGAFDHTQHNVSLRHARADHASHGTSAHAHAGRHDAGPRAHGLAYLLVEAARTDEGADGVRAFRYESVLAEAQWRWHGWGVAVRGERTDRPEPERLLDLYRTPAGHIDFQIVGITRFDVVTAQLTLPPSRWRALEPFAEVAAARPVARRRPAVFDPPAFYGARTQWMLSAGVRLHAGRMRPRMGRYGVLAP